MSEKFRSRPKATLRRQGVRLIDAPDFLRAYRPEAEAGAAFSNFCGRSRTWTGPFSLRPWFAPGERTGVFRLGADQLIVNEASGSSSFEDFAMALIDELENPAPGPKPRRRSGRS